MRAPAGHPSAIIGPRNREQLTDNVAALDVVLTGEVLARVDEIAPPGQATHPYYGPQRADWHPDRWHATSPTGPITTRGDHGRIACISVGPA